MKQHTNTIFRLNRSKYQATNYIELEGQLINQIPHCNYIDELSKQPNILITNSNSNLKDWQNKIDFSKIELIIHPNSGHENLSQSIINDHNIPTVLGNEIRAHSVSMYIVSSILRHFQVIPFKNQWDEKREWNRQDLSNLNILMFGHGHIGTILSQLLPTISKALDIVDPKKGPYLKPPQKLNEYDIIILACDLNSSNYHLIDEKLLDQLKKSVLIVNPARGALIDLDALRSFLSNHPESFAILDVFEKEPFDFDYFKKLKNIKCSSHIAGVFKNLDQKILDFVNKTISDFTRLNKQDFNQLYKKKLL